MLDAFFLDAKLDEHKATGSYRSLTTLSQGTTPLITLAGQQYINFASNDYLGLARHPQVVASLSEAALQLQQVGSGASHLITGHHLWHEALAKTLAKASGYEAALTFSTGYMANLAVLQALASRDTVIFSDKLNHASIIDGATLSRARLIRFTHRDYNQLESRLAATPNPQKIIITDHVFSMDGTLANLACLQRLARRYRCALVVDDAHGFGLPYQAGNLADVYVGTLGKAIGTMGAFVAGSHQLVEYLINTARPYIYTTAMAPAMVYATNTAVQLAIEDKERQARLLANIATLSHGLIKQGWQVGLMDAEPAHPTYQTAIIPVIVGDNALAQQLSKQLRQAGFWVAAIRPPTVPVGTARLRFCVSSSHTPAQLEALLQVMQRLIRSL